MSDEEPHDTPRLCEACGGRGGQECRWCDAGFQDVGQQKSWREFRRRMRAISGTYSIVASTMSEFIERLEKAGSDETRSMAKEGTDLLRAWTEADPDSPERRKASVDISLFQRKALMLLISRA